jgi:uncharacterized membrane protein SpoIIM required for sporulation
VNPFNEEIGQIYERFLELPGAVVVAMLWLVGAVVLGGTSALALYLGGLVLGPMLAGV